MANIKEITSYPPIQFMADGTDMRDWIIRGAPGGVGNVSSNYLKQREYSSADELDNGAQAIYKCFFTRRQALKIIASHPYRRGLRIQKSISSGFR